KADDITLETYRAKRRWSRNRRSSKRTAPRLTDVSWRGGDRSPQKQEDHDSRQGDIEPDRKKPPRHLPMRLEALFPGEVEHRQRQGRDGDREDDVADEDRIIDAWVGADVVRVAVDEVIGDVADEEEAEAGEGEHVEPLMQLSIAAADRDDGAD